MCLLDRSGNANAVGYRTQKLDVFVNPDAKLIATKF
jgi:hypothetical protein